jgi:hypothetical protein
MQKDLHDNILTTRAFAPKAATTDNTAYVSTIIDTFGYESLELVLVVGNAGTGATFALLLEDGNQSNLSDNATVPDTNTLGTQAGAAFASANTNVTVKLGYKGPNRYVRATVTPSGNTGNFFLAGAWIQSSPKKAPVTAQLN